MNKAIKIITGRKIVKIFLNIRNFLIAILAMPIGMILLSLLAIQWFFTEMTKAGEDFYNTFIKRK